MIRTHVRIGGGVVQGGLRGGRRLGERYYGWAGLEFSPGSTMRNEP